MNDNLRICKHLEQDLFKTKKAFHIGKPFIGWTEQQFGFHNLGLKRDTTQLYKDKKGI